MYIYEDSPQYVCEGLLWQPKLLAKHRIWDCCLEQPNNMHIMYKDFVWLLCTTFCKKNELTVQNEIGKSYKKIIS